MKLSELIARLEEIREEVALVYGERFDPDVLGAYQPSYPLAGDVRGAAVLDDGKHSTVWIAIGAAPHGASPYAPDAAFEVDR